MSEQETPAKQFATPAPDEDKTAQEEAAAEEEEGPFVTVRCALL